MMAEPAKKRGQPPKPLEMKLEALDLIRQGESNASIGRKLGVDGHVVAKWRREAGLPKIPVGGVRIDP